MRSGSHLPNNQLYITKKLASTVVQHLRALTSKVQSSLIALVQTFKPVERVRYIDLHKTLVLVGSAMDELKFAHEQGWSIRPHGANQFTVR